jgi:nucleoside-diphosphate-sugar epimerase
VPQLAAAGYQVSGTTRSAAKADGLRALGADPFVLDTLDGAAVGEAVAKAEPEVVVFEATALAENIDLRKFQQTFAATDKLRTTGLDNVMAAAAAQGVRRFIAQSYAGWPNIRTGGPVKTEEDPFDPDPPAAQRQALNAIMHLERVVTTAPLEGLALRYGNLYGPGSSEVMVSMLKRRRVPLIGDAGGIWSFLHVTDAAAATVTAIGGGARGIYNIVDDEPAPVAEWLPVLASAAGAKPPWHLPAWIGKLAAGEAAMSMFTQVRGSSNAKAKAELGWQPIWPTWRDGFMYGLEQAYPPAGLETDRK